MKTPTKIRRDRIPWNWFALLAPIVGYFCALVVAEVGARFIWGEKLFAGFMWWLSAWTVVCVFGLAAGARSIHQKERFWGLTAIGIVLNSVLPLFFLYLFILFAANLFSQ